MHYSLFVTHLPRTDFKFAALTAAPNTACTSRKELVTRSTEILAEQVEAAFIMMSLA
jgi:hypothetical protein